MRVILFFYIEWHFFILESWNVQNSTESQVPRFFLVSYS